MATSPEGYKAALHKALMRVFSAHQIPISLTKAEFRAPVDGLDGYFDANAAAINNAIPQPARAQLTPSSKAVFATGVLIMRYMVDNPTALEMMVDLVNAAISAQQE